MVCRWARAADLGTADPAGSFWYVDTKILRLGQSIDRTRRCQLGRSARGSSSVHDTTRGYVQMNWDDVQVVYSPCAEISRVARRHFVGERHGNMRLSRHDVHLQVEDHQANGSLQRSIVLLTTSQRAGRCSLICLDDGNRCQCLDLPEHSQSNTVWSIINTKWSCAHTVYRSTHGR